MKKTKKEGPKPADSPKERPVAEELREGVMDPGSPRPSASTFPIVGIGASAGGLSAFEAFFSGMPLDREPDMAFVLVQHLAPDHKSLLADLISRYTHMQVFEVETGMEVRPNCAYIIPPGKDLALRAGALHLSEPLAPHGQRLPIDRFFCSLAMEQREKAICVVLSGTGNDGSLGLRAIKGEGGMAMAQAPDGIEFDGMPRGAIATGLVDYVLPPAKMPAALIAYAARAFKSPSPGADKDDKSQERLLKRILSAVRTQTGHDFSGYKVNTVLRRIQRRMAVRQAETLEAYLALALQNPAEVEMLFRDLLIGVTSFFRDKEAFAVLEKEVIAGLFDATGEGGTIRIWAPGCSTGEEAYSLAILVAEGMQRSRQNRRVQIFATDIDAEAITVARAGLYPSSIAADLTPERLARFFSMEPNSGGYRVHKPIRDMLIFSEQDLIRDPPFSRLDLVCCRNLLIYMGAELHRRLLPLFHYALATGGCLFLGGSENIGEYEQLFSTIDRKAKVYRAKPALPLARRVDFGRRQEAQTGSDAMLQPTLDAALPKPSLRDLVEATLIKELAPVAALVNEEGDILYLYGRTGTFLEPAPGEAGINNIHKMAREGLRHGLFMGLRKAAATKEAQRLTGLRLQAEGRRVELDLTILPKVSGPPLPEANPLYLVIMEEREDSGDAIRDVSPRDGGTARAGSADAGFDAIRRELRAKEEYLQTANEELETANEELKSSNEEMQSVNEELQSTNEELETSKEELQSVNEELVTVNAELQAKIGDLSRANNDMNNLISGTGIGTVFVDHELRILRFTPAAARIMNLIPGDVGRPVGHIVSNLVGYAGLVADTRAVLDGLVPREVEVMTGSGIRYAMRILPYRTLDNQIEGAVITFVDITELKRTEEEHGRLLVENQGLLAELQHRAKNSFNMISAMINIAASAAGSDAVKTALDDLDNRVNSVSTLYSLLYSSGSFSEVELDKYCEGIARPLIGLSGSIALDLALDSIKLPVKEAAPVGLIVTELITNALKHAFPGGRQGRIELRLSRAGDRVSLLVRDDGTGLPARAEDGQKPGMGLHLVRSLTAQLKGSFRVEGGGGTTCVLDFPLPTGAPPAPPPP
jgi:two-component system CheB/CheR fusion protein